MKLKFKHVSILTLIELEILLVHYLCNNSYTYNSTYKRFNTIFLYSKVVRGSESYIK